MNISDGSNLILHGLEVECDGLILTLDCVRVNLHNLVITGRRYDGVDETGEGDVAQLGAVHVEGGDGDLGGLESENIWQPGQ